MDIIKSLTSHGISSRKHRTIYKKLGKLMTEHQHAQWIERNQQIPHEKTTKKRHQEKTHHKKEQKKTVEVGREKRQTRQQKACDKFHKEQTAAIQAQKGMETFLHKQQKPTAPKADGQPTKNDSEIKEPKQQPKTQKRATKTTTTAHKRKRQPREEPNHSAEGTTQAQEIIPTVDDAPEAPIVPNDNSVPTPQDRPLQPIPRQMELMRQPLSPGEEDHLRNFLRPSELPRRSPKETVVTSGRHYIDRTTMYTRLTRRFRTPLTTAQKRSKHLDGNIIDSYLNQIAVRAFENGHRILCLPTHSMTLEREPIRVWPSLQHRIIKDIDLSSIHTILIPLNVRARHWSLAHVNIENQEISIYDSVYNKATQKKYIKKLLKLLAIAPGLEDIRWKVRPTTDFPQQTNNYDCGLFICAAALTMHQHK